jgi:hypothetical protein
MTLGRRTSTIKITMTGAAGTPYARAEAVRTYSVRIAGRNLRPELLEVGGEEAVRND